MKKTIMSKVNYPQVVDLQVLSECLFDCKYCFGPKNIPMLDYDKIAKILDNLSKYHVERVVITGGEPLIRPDIDKILNKIVSLGMKISLSTTGEFFFNHKMVIDKCVDHLSLPIDEPNENFTYRSKSQFNNVLRILEEYKNNIIRPKIKIGTVCTKENFDLIEEIGELLLKYKGSFDFWKIYQFCPINVNATKNRKKLEISNELYWKTVDRIKNKYLNTINVVTNPRVEKEYCHFLISPNGDAFINKEMGEIIEEVIIGNLINDDWDQILEKWNNLIKFDNYQDNISKTFQR